MSYLLYMSEVLQQYYYSTLLVSHFCSVTLHYNSLVVPVTYVVGSSPILPRRLPRWCNPINSIKKSSSPSHS